MYDSLKIATLLTGLALPAGMALAQDQGTTSGNVAADTVVATVNGTDITLGEMIITRQQLPEQYQQLPDEVLFSGILDQLVQQQLLADTLEETPSRLEIALANEERALRAGEVLEDIYAEAVTDEAVQAAYEARVAEMGDSMEWNASHILVETQEEAAEIKDLVVGGADFAETAQERSTGPSGSSGGELGWFGPGMMVAPFEEALTTMETGDVSEPVQTQFGWHIVKLNDTRMQAAPALDEIRQEIVSQLQESALQARLDELGESAEVDRAADGDFDPAVINDLGLIED
ncbi:peptidylprolyl isomerase [Salibaculum sp.]|jgi:peptidyl-prolyl cis-trans isomerase C|uniref:peptidylprolyl isomerase n=1 Tax=Salibaculum sp. TaxID=2855480 RepID=UPI002B461D7D|nr:peptidylprolyl isomerase [Salibaculum sp.]HKL70923.1 peptidylprolyl isomerase [Salibaculum sp.]